MPHWESPVKRWRDAIRVRYADHPIRYAPVRYTDHAVPYAHHSSFHSPHVYTSTSTSASDSHEKMLYPVAFVMLLFLVILLATSRKA